jgi:hypothetical protein
MTRWKTDEHRQLLPGMNISCPAFYIDAFYIDASLICPNDTVDLAMTVPFNIAVT